MKFTLIAAVVVLALAQGSFAQDAAADQLAQVSQAFEEWKAKITGAVTEMLQNQDMANQAQTYMADKKTQLEPLAAQVQEQLRTAASKMEEHMQPMVEKLQQQFEALFAGLRDQAPAVGN